MSMLAGEQGRQAEELNRLADWLGTQARPDVVHLSNALLLGLAEPLKRRFGAPIVCSLQDEDTWIDAMAPAATARLWQVLIGKSAAVDRFVAVSRYYAEVMQERLRIPPARMQVVPAGIDMEGHTAAPLATDPPVIGYLSRLAEAEGFGLLVEAFMRLKAKPPWRALKLRATGGQTADNAAFIRKHQRALAACGWASDLELLPAFDKPARLKFLQSLSILSVPALKGEAFGTYLIEAMASGVPVVQPRLGAFPEIVESTGGGILYAPNTADALAAALESLLRDPAQARALGQRGQESVRATYDLRLVAERLAEIYRQCTRA